jgi:glutathione S-transferase
VVGDRYTIADIACFSWVNWAEWAGVDVAEFPWANHLELGKLMLIFGDREVKKWVDRINARGAVKRGLDVPEPFKMKEMMKTKEGEEEYTQHHSSWVMKGQEKDQATHK